MSEERDMQTEEQQNAEENSVVVEDVEVIEADEVSVDDELQTRISELEAALLASETKVKDQQDSVLRARADMENARRRADTEVEKARKFALERFANELLPVIDNLERAIQMSDADNDQVKPLLEGVEMTLRTFNSAIEKFGMKAIDPQGESFNPELHQAMSMQESADMAPNTVMAVMQKGYELNGRLLRPAMVMVSRAPDAGVDTQA